jgi:osmotically-inducible protein OsmY
MAGMEVIMHRLVFILIIMIVVAIGGCSGGRSGADRPGGMTGTSGGATTGTGTAAPTGTIGTGSTTDPASTGAVIPKEGESSIDPDDSVLRSSIVDRLKEAGFGETIKVETDDGIVTLKGTASSQAEIEKIIKLVQGLQDVESVTSELTVR